MNPHTASLMLAETAVPVFLMSVAKPLVTLAAFVPYAAIVSGKLEKDAGYYNLKPIRWALIFLGFGTAALLAALLIPTWFAGFPVMLALMVAPCAWYMSFRNKALAGTKAKPLTFLDIDFGKMAAARRAKAARAAATLRFQAKDRSERAVPDRKDPAFEAYAELEKLLLAAMEARASRIEVGLTKQGAQVMLVVDSVRVRRDPIAGDLGTRTVDMLKGFAELDPAERRKMQRGTAAILRDGDRTVLTVSSVGSMQGETLRIDFEREKQLAIPAAKLGMTEQQQKLLDDTLLSNPRGVVLVGAKAGQGLTTLAYSLLGRHDALISNIKTIERRVERNVDGVEHMEFDGAKADWATQLQTLVRRGPDVIFTADIADPGTAKVVCSPNAGETLFYVGLPSDSVIDVLGAWIKAVGDPKAASGRLRVFVGQRLVRKLCMTCRAEYVPGAAEAKMLAIPAGKNVKVYKQTGKVLIKDQPAECPTCKGSGFVGVTAAIEVLPFDDQARELLAAGDVKGAVQHCRRTFKCPSVQDAALLKVRAGETSFDEVKRVFAPPAAAAPAAAAGAKPAAAAKPAAKPAAPASKPKA